jgi:hypothetical protein
MNEPVLASFALVSGTANRQFPREFGATGAGARRR